MCVEHGGASKLLKEVAQAGPEQLPDLEQKAVKAANQAQSQVNQAEAVSRMVRDQMLQNKDAISACIAQAGRAAAEKAESVSSVLLAWGYGPDSHEPEQRAADMELVARVNQSSVLMEVARYLGRLKELMDGKRKNGYAYGRGEKYTLELGGDINRAIASEFAMLATPGRRCRFSCGNSRERVSSSISAGSPSAKGAATLSVCWTSLLPQRAKRPGARRWPWHCWTLPCGTSADFP